MVYVCALILALSCLSVFSFPFLYLLSPIFFLFLTFVSLFFPTGKLLNSTFMATQDKGRPLPKFGEWDVNNPASAEGFTVIFSKARDEKKSNVSAAAAGGRPPSQRNVSRPEETYQHAPSKKWFCCF